jgi:hypothetical protein
MCVCVYVFVCVLTNNQQHSEKYLQTHGGSSTHSSCETVVRTITFSGERSCGYLCLSDRARERERERERERVQVFLWRFLTCCCCRIQDPDPRNHDTITCF